MDQNISIQSVLARSQTIAGSTLWAYMMFILLGLVVPWVLFVNSEGEFSANVLLMLCIVVWCQLRLAYTGLTGQRRLTLMCFYAFIYVFLGVQPLLSISTHAFPNNIYLSDGLVTFTGLLVILGIVAFETGYVFGYRKVDAARLYKHPSKIMSLRMLWYVTAAVSGLTVLAILFYGPGLFVYGGDVFGSREIGQTESLLVTFGVRVPAAVLLFLAVYLWKAYKCLALPGYRVWSLRAALLFLGVLNFVVSMPFTTPRLWMGSLLLTVLFISMRWRGIRSFLIWTTLACLSLLILFSGTDPRRFAAQLNRDESITPASVTLLIKDAVQGLGTDANFDAFAMLASTTQYTDNYGYSWGHQLLLPGFFWVPRSIWNSKPEGTPKSVADFINLYNLNVSCPLWAEGYVNFGIFGVFMFLFFFGWLARVGDDFQVQATGRPGPALQTVISSFFAANTFILLRGDLTSGTMYLQLVIVFSFLILFLNRCLKTPRPMIYGN